MTSQRPEPNDPEFPTPAATVDSDDDWESYQPQPLGRIAGVIRSTAIIAVFPAFALFYLTQALTITLPNRVLLVSPRGFPTVVAVAMVVVTILLAVLEIIRLLRRREATRTGLAFTEAEDDDRERISSWREVWVTLAALVAYILLFDTLGFAISTFLFLAGVSTFLNHQHWLRNVIVSALFSGAVFYLFSVLLGVQLPLGLLSGIL